MVAIDQVRVKLNMRVRPCLDGGVGLFCRCSGGDVSEESTGGQVDEGSGEGGKSLGRAADFDDCIDVEMGWWWCPVDGFDVVCSGSSVD